MDNPFRPTLDRFADDPAELNVDTTMDAGGGGRGKDILEVAQQLDKMQRNYLSHNTGGMATQKLPAMNSQTPLSLQALEQNMPGAPQQFISGGQSHF